jgi:hypothetical protein
MSSADKILLVFFSTSRNIYFKKCTFFFLNKYIKIIQRIGCRCISIEFLYNDLDWKTNVYFKLDVYIYRFMIK